MNDIEDFTTEQLCNEIMRRVAASREGRCWYCGRELTVHTCKHAVRPATAEEIARNLT